MRLLRRLRAILIVEWFEFGGEFRVLGLNLFGERRELENSCGLAVGHPLDGTKLSLHRAAANARVVSKNTNEL